MKAILSGELTPHCGFDVYAFLTVRNAEHLPCASRPPACLLEEEKST